MRQDKAFDPEPPIASLLKSMLIGGGPVNASVIRLPNINRENRMQTGVSELDHALERLANARDRDEHHKLLGELAPIAAQHVETIALKFEHDSFPKFNTIWALIGQTDENVIELFCRALSDPDKYVRWAASEALARCNDSAAIQALVTALKDRSTLVKGVAVTAMKHLKPKTAVPQLKKIVQSKHLMKHSPGIVADANIALNLIENVG